MSKKVIITGTSGQDGSYMADYLLENTNYDIYGMVRRAAKPDYSNISEALKNKRFKLITGDLSDSQSIENIVSKIKPNFFINLAAQSFVASSWEVPEQTIDINATGVMRCLEAIKRHVPNCIFYNAGSSEEFGDVQEMPQNEKSEKRARSPYGASKIAARQIVKTYRESYNMFAIQGILYNHESPRRGTEFVTRKISQGVATIYDALKNNRSFYPIELGNLEAKRDWSHAKDFVEGIWLMMNHKEPKEYVLASGETHSIREFISLAFKEVGIEITFRNLGGKEEQVGFIKDNNFIPVVVVNPIYYRPAEVDILLGDSSLARKELGWYPKYSFEELVSEMVQSDIKNLTSS